MDASSLSSSPCFVGEKIEEDVNADDNESKKNSCSVKFDIDDIPDLPFVSVVNTADNTKGTQSNEELQRRIRILESNESALRARIRELEAEKILMLTVARSERLRDMVDNDILSQNNTSIVKSDKAKENKSSSSVVEGGEVREYVREDSLQQVYEMGWLPNPISINEGNTEEIDHDESTSSRADSSYEYDRKSGGWICS